MVFTNHAQSDKPLAVSDIQVVDDATALLVTIRYSKTNQRGRPTTLRIPISNNPAVCCVSAVKHYLKLRPVGCQYFFCHANNLPLTRSQFSAVLAKAVFSLGLPSNVYTSHSFRIGRATTLSAKGVSNEIIKTLGRWKSAAFEGYIRH